MISVLYDSLTDKLSRNGYDVEKLLHPWWKFWEDTQYKVTFRATGAETQLDGDDALLTFCNNLPKA